MKETIPRLSHGSSLSRCFPGKTSANTTWQTPPSSSSFVLSEKGTYRKAQGQPPTGTLPGPWRPQYVDRECGLPSEVRPSLGSRQDPTVPRTIFYVQTFLRFHFKCRKVLFLKRRTEVTSWHQTKEEKWENTATGRRCVKESVCLF